ncbi:hypothetical protein EPI10_000533 [Gossypium australe]|uniref:Retrotransposon gag domain-containing protein n=1 Tax=Gossypium australe TaxID=47621 RepID=A0A5B6V847_9ROSI|nr:hypothetical protein EPI10_000533 [Gossypium australe]
MKEQMMKAEKNTVAPMTQLLNGVMDKGQGSMTNAGEDNEDFPLGFIPPHAQTQPEVYPRRPSVTIRPQQGQINAGVPMNFQVGTGSNSGDNPANPVIPDLDIAVGEGTRIESLRQLEDRCRWLEEKFKALENANNKHGIDAKDLSLVLDLVLPHKFKMPEFEKYNGTSCPEAHITMFYRLMTGYVNNDQHLIHCFQYSLVGAASRWYNQLNRARISSWRDLAQAFMKQYNHVTDMTPDRITLQNMEKKSNESFRNFADIVMAGEMIENAIRGGKIEARETTKRSASRKQENEVNNTSTYNKGYSKAITVSQPKVITAGQQGVRDYCEFHKAEGHEIQECVEFRDLVQSFINNKELEVYEEGSGGGSICVTEGELANQKVNYPRIIITRPRNTKLALPRRSKVNDLTHVVEGEEEAKEFLKFLKHSEYSVIEQLRKQSACISVLALLLSSEVHREALMKVLNETYVTKDISVNKLDRLVSNISADNFIYFTDDEIPPGGMGSTKALHITTRCKVYTLPSMLINNGLALNVLPFSTLKRLPIDSSHMKTCQNIVRAFDGTEIKDIIATVTNDAPNLESNEEVTECSFRSLEFVNATFILEGNEVPVPRISRTTRISLQMMVGKGALPGKGLGGIIHPERGLLENENLHINAIHEEGIEQRNLLGIHSYELGSVLNN